MKPEARLEVASNSRQQAEAYFNKNNFGRSFAHSLVALSLCPEWKPEFKHKFSSILCSWGAELESQKRYKDLFHCYEQALEVYEDSEEILNNLGAHLYRLGHVQEASHYFRKALLIDPDFLPARRNLLTVSNAVVERWHFRMLNDRARNEAYREAIFKKIKQKFDTVLDIGTGTGILSMFAVDSGARSVYACDVSPTMFQIANDVTKANNLSKKVHLLNKLSNDLNIPNDLPEKVSLVVTEIMDCGLLGEHVLSALSDAWKRLLFPPCEGLSSSRRKASELKECNDGNEDKSKMKDDESETWTRSFWRYTSRCSSEGHGIVVPFGATVCLAGIECHSLSRRYFLHPDSCVKNHLNIPGLVIATARNVHGDEEDPYNAEDLENLPGGYRYLVDPKEAIYVNFNDPEEIEDRLSGHFPEETLEVKVSNSGRLDAVATWFVLDVDEDIKLSTAPGKGSCWEQALYPLYPSVYVTEGQTLQYAINCTGRKLLVTAKVIEGDKSVSAEEETVSSVKDLNEEKCFKKPEGCFTQNDNQNQLACSKVKEAEVSVAEVSAESKNSPLKCVTSQIAPVSAEKHHRLSEKSVAFLNNNLWVETIITASKSFLGVGERKSVLDMNPFPIFGLMLLKHDASKSLVWCSNSSGSLRIEEKRSFFEIASANGIEADRLKYESDDTLNGEFDVVFCDLLDPEGEIQESVIGKLPALLQMMNPNGILMPRRMRVKAQLLFSEWLAKMSQVLSDENVCNYKIAEFINIYKVPQHLDLDMNSLVKDACSQPVEVMEWDIRGLSASEPVKGSKIVEIEMTKDCTVNAIAYWYEEEIVEDMWVSSFGCDSHLKQAATIFPLELSASGKSKLPIKITHHHGLTHLQLDVTVLESLETVEDFQKKLNIQDQLSS